MLNYPKVYNPGGDLLAILDNINTNKASIFRKLNSEYNFSFEMFEKELKSEFVTTVNNIKIENQLFDIVYIENAHKITDEVNSFVQCEHVSYRLISGEVDFYAFVGTPVQILTDILSGTDFSVGTVDFTTPISFTVNESATKLRLIQLLAASLVAEIDYSNNGFDVDLKNSIGEDNGFEVRLGKNMRSIKSIVDKRGVLKTYYNVNILELKDSDVYIQNGFDVLETLGIADTIKIKDPRIGVDVTNKVITKTWNPIKSIQTFVELSNQIEFLSDELVSIEVNSVNKNEFIYGVKLTGSEGLVIERNDKFAKSVFNADAFEMMVGDGLGGYTPAVFFDIIAKLYKFIGILEVTNTSNVKVKIDPDGANILEVLDGATSLFTVSASGVATFSDTISTAKNALIGNSIQLGATLSGLHALLFGPGTSGYNITASSSGMTITGQDGVSLDTNGDLDLNGDITTFGSTGKSGSFTTVDGKTITVFNGIVVGIV